jgi:hypothetical protein
MTPSSGAKHTPHEIMRYLATVMLAGAAFAQNGGTIAGNVLDMAGE